MKITIKGDNHQEVAQLLHRIGAGHPVNIHYPPVDQHDYQYPTSGHEMTVTVTLPADAVEYELAYTPRRDPENDQPLTT